MFLPDNVQTGFKPRGERTKTEIALSGGIDKFIQCDGATDARPYKQGSIEDKIIGNGDVQFVNCFANPFQAWVMGVTMAENLTGEEEGQSLQIGRRDFRFGS